MRLRAHFPLLLLTLPAACLAVSDDPLCGPTTAGQSAADALREATGADGALMPGELISKSLQNDDLASTLKYPDETYVVVRLTGNQLKQAFERSVSLYPEQNVGFLQIAGFQITFRKQGPPDSRVTDVEAGGSKLEDGRSYDVAMPTSLQRGQLGYSNIWDKAKIVHTYPKTTLLDALKGRRVAPSAPRWVSQG